MNKVDKNISLTDVKYYKKFNFTPGDLQIFNQLANIGAARNYLTSFDYSRLNPQTLRSLNVVRNKLEKTDIEVFSLLVNLEDLEIEGNKFYGSLESLKNCTKLESLIIHCTDINRGIEYLPNSLIFLKT
ncbi:hypothetical protein CONCODRAFT_9180 [Conidiobolus coronatus NRRL 28638]|uniref:L domain-like protein n=1 Tax=Conidiobolus coronatus (strain ATCC 28846 / CBS 209.66 / NRRL 28638) TaxID=796925 RepID=A0A137P0Q9_CONC2|nr:hypothetical protein CONCODRAFT_9180 [Conidiobolus coronatus NRRL 28638]|eukprot:KXN68582.1 hypothetical protein CONCODRAFT_9180 [Conidiobolus coronatus NRRL 28638]